MSFPGLPSEKAAVAAVLAPVNGNNAANSSGYIDMRRFHEAMFILALGVIDAVVDFKLQEAKDGSGTGAQDLAGKAITQFAATDDGKVAIINVKAEELSVNVGFTHVKAVATVGSGTSSLIAVIGLGLSPRFAPASDAGDEAVAQIIS
ncbi:MAG: hypothetical protein ACK4RK_10775 [Gemmataceae bacterium]